MTPLHNTAARRAVMRTVPAAGRLKGSADIAASAMTKGARIIARAGITPAHSWSKLSRVLALQPIRHDLSLARWHVDHVFVDARPSEHRKPAALADALERRVLVRDGTPIEDPALLRVRYPYAVVALRRAETGHGGWLRRCHRLAA